MRVWEYESMGVRVFTFPYSHTLILPYSHTLILVLLSLQTFGGIRHCRTDRLETHGDDGDADRNQSC